MAYNAMIDAGFQPELPPDAARELAALGHDPTPTEDMRDLRSLLWSSIDNRESRDLDQIEFAEEMSNGDIRVMIGIADVDAFVPKGSALDRHAAWNATSVYTGISTFPMLPERLSEDITSLLPGRDRLAVVTEVVLDPEGIVRWCDAYRAVVHNHAKLAYEPVGAWLDGTTAMPPEVAAVSGLAGQLHLQSVVMQRLEAYRQRNGALNLETIEARPVAADGRIVDLVLKEENPARDLIENIMVAANSAMAEFLKSRGSLSIQRIVREPQRWPRIVDLARSFGEQLPPQPDSKALSAFLMRRKAADPLHYPDLSFAVVKLLGAGEYAVITPDMADEEHFGLAVHGYARTTAPNRRYTDLITQRLLKAAIAGAPAPYTVEELEATADRCRERESNARKVERFTRKVGAAMLLSESIGHTYRGIVTGVSNKGTFARLLSPPAEGRIVHGEEGLEVGDMVTLRLTATDPERGFIDFVRVAEGRG